MRKKNTLILLSALFFSACVHQNIDPDTSKVISNFSTNKNTFITSKTHLINTKEARNNYLNNFLINSDMQCVRYLTQSQTIPIESSSEEEGLYMAIFDTVSLIFGTKQITDTAKRAFKTTSPERQENKTAYKTALSPEVLKGVRIARARSAKEIEKHQNDSIKTYTTSMLNTDLASYDKQCSEHAGLIEINKALKLAQNRIMQSPQPIENKIDPQKIKKSVEKVTKEVEQKKLSINKVILETKIKGDNNTSI